MHLHRLSLEPWVRFIQTFQEVNAQDIFFAEFWVLQGI